MAADLIEVPFLTPAHLRLLEAVRFVGDDGRELRGDDSAELLTMDRELRALFAQISGVEMGILRDAVDVVRHAKSMLDAGQTDADGRFLWKVRR